MWEGNDKFTFHISDEINGNLFLLEDAESIRRMPRDRPKLTENVCPHSTMTTSLALSPWRPVTLTATVPPSVTPHRTTSAAGDPRVSMWAALHRARRDNRDDERRQRAGSGSRTLSGRRWPAVTLSLSHETPANALPVRSMAHHPLPFGYVELGQCRLMHCDISACCM